MRQPPRQPPRQPARNTARRAAPKAAQGARGGKPAARSAPRQQARKQQMNASARAAQHARDAQRVQQQRNRTGGPTGRPTASGGGKRDAKGRPLRGWRSWWATYEMDRRHKAQGARSGAGGRSVGVLASRGWTAGRAGWALLLLLLSAFTGSAALGAQSGGLGVLAFVFLLSSIAVATSARAKAYFSSFPARTAPVADFHIDDLKVDEEAPGLDESELNSLDDLERSMQRAQQNPSDGDGAARIPRQTPTDTAAVTAPRTETRALPAAPAITEMVTPHEEAAPREEEAVSAEVATAADDDQTAQPASNTDRVGDQPAGTGQDSTQAPVEDVPSEETSGPSTPSGGEDSATPDIEDAPTDSPDTELDDASAELMQPLVDSESAAIVDDPDSSEPSTQLTLLASGGSGSDLLSVYAEETTLPPEAVRDVAATLIVSDLAASVMFYTELLGLVEIDRARDAVLLEAGFGRVLLWRREDAPPSGGPVMHVTFEVGDIDSAYRTLSSRGVKFTHPPRSALSGEVHDLRAASFLDPDGHGLAITELKQRSESVAGQ